VQALTDAHRAQVINYVHTADLDLGLLVNFGSYPNLQWERFLHSRLSPRKTIADDPPSF
jgi:GxxExxY protein